jgi:hypothetical protein
VITRVSKLNGLAIFLSIYTQLGWHDRFHLYPFCRLQAPKEIFAAALVRVRNLARHSTSESE